MDLINGKPDVDVNTEIDKYSSRGRVYAMGSAGDLDEPLYLFVDEQLTDGLIILKYIPDSDNDGKSDPEIPVKRIVLQK